MNGTLYRGDAPFNEQQLSSRLSHIGTKVKRGIEREIVCRFEYCLSGTEGEYTKHTYICKLISRKQYGIIIILYTQTHDISAINKMTSPRACAFGGKAKNRKIMATTN